MSDDQIDASNATDRISSGSCCSWPNRGHHDFRLVHHQWHCMQRNQPVQLHWSRYLFRHVRFSGIFFSHYLQVCYRNLLRLDNTNNSTTPSNGLPADPIFHWIPLAQVDHHAKIPAFRTTITLFSPERTASTLQSYPFDVYVTPACICHLQPQLFDFQIFCTNLCLCSSVDN